MTKTLEFLKDFLNSGLGLLVLGFVFTTVIGTYINFTVQRDLAENQRDFEIFKIRLEEAKKIQSDFFEKTNERMFHLSNVVVRLREPVSDESCSEFETEFSYFSEKRGFATAVDRGDIGSMNAKCYWEEIYSPVKDKWNEVVVTYEGTLRALFHNSIANLFLSDEEDRKYDFRDDWKC